MLHRDAISSISSNTLGTNNYLWNEGHIHRQGPDKIPVCINQLFFLSLNIYCNRWICVRIFFKYSYTKNDFNKYILSENINWSLKILHRSIYFRIVSSPDDFLGGLSEDTINPRSLDLFE